MARETSTRDAQTQTPGMSASVSFVCVLSLAAPADTNLDSAPRGAEPQVWRPQQHGLDRQHALKASQNRAADARLSIIVSGPFVIMNLRVIP